MNLVDASGERLQSSTHSMVTGTIELNVSNYAEGFYYIKNIDSKKQ